MHIDWIDVDGGRLRRLRAEGAPGRSFVLLHGNPSRLEHWAPLIPALTPLGSVVAFELPGFGATPPIGTPTLDNFARILGPLLPPDAVLVGHSHGGLVSLALSASLPASVPAVLLSPAGIRPNLAYRLLRLVPPRWMGDLARGAARGGVARLLARASVWWGLLSNYAPDPIPAGAQEEEFRFLCEAPWLAESMCLVTREDPCRIVKERLPQVRGPVLILHGYSDRVVSCSLGRELAEALGTRARFEPHPGGHLFFYPGAARVAASIRAWLAEIS
jgi:pimeloyl-ACP methyl ester carboxylesterase